MSEPEKWEHCPRCGSLVPAQPQRSESCIVTGASSRICERGTKSCEVKHDAASSEPQRPTIAELEAVLDEKVERHIEINPDGSLRVTRPSSESSQEWPLQRLDELLDLIRGEAARFAAAALKNGQDVTRLEGELAAERENWRVAVGNLATTARENAEQLAAEREKLAAAVKFIERCGDHMICGSGIADTPLPTEQEWRDALALAK